MRRRISRRAFTITGIAGLLFLAGSTAQAGWLFVLAAGVLGLVAASLVTKQNLSGAHIERIVPQRARVGDDVRLVLTVSNTGRRTLPLMRLEDAYPGFEPSVVVSNRLRRGETAHIELVKNGFRRGRFHTGPVTLRSGAPFGFASASKVIDVATEVTLVPRYVELRSFPILEPSSSPSDVLHERARTGAGQEYLGVREYRPGDPPRSVHWRSTARVGRLVVREYEEEVQTRVTLVLAGRDTGTPPDSPFEALVSATASIAMYAIVTGHPVDILQPLPDGSIDHVADPDRFEVLDWLAGATPVDASHAPLVIKALSRVGRRGTVVLLSPTTGAAIAGLEDAVRTVQSAGSRAIVVAAKSTTWGEDTGEAPVEEDPTLRTLIGGRATVMTISKGEELTSCLG